MERQFNNGDFEKLLRDNANQYRMYPSEKVWKGVHSALHTRRRWYGLTALILFLITGTGVSLLILNDKPRKENISEQIATVKQDKIQGGSSVSNKIITQQKQFTPAVNNQFSAPTVAPVSDLNKTYLVNINPEVTENISETGLATLSPNNPAPIDETEILKENQGLAEDFYSKRPLNHTNSTSGIIDKIATAQNPIADASISKAIIDPGVVDELTEKKINEAISALASQNVAPIQSKRKARVTGQLYFTPTVSYRKLTENKRVFSGSSFYVPTIDLNNVVKHKPAMGLEFGFEGRYRLSKAVAIKTGLQFNINRYDISAYSHPTEIATVALNSGSGVDSLATLTNIRNSNTTSANWLENFSFQTSLPVGVEFTLGDHKNVQWGVSATIQPTYVIGDRAYVISSDYKNYAKFPDLMRRWNISTGVGAFVSYSTGRIRWQAGPHVRYQHLSSFVSALTIKEKLYAIGLKVGATLEKKK